MPHFEFEEALYAAGYSRVAGVDEVGRGPLAGPVCAAAAVLPRGYHHPLLNDSKKLSEKKRDLLYAELSTDPRILWKVVMVDVQTIDRINILQATRLAMKQAVAQLAEPVDAALIDGLPVPDFPLHQQAIVKGDSLSYSIAAASVLAKVTRDRHMLELAALYPGYGLEVHKGYPTAVHLSALRQLGPCPEHRRSFAPVSQLQLPL
jgi:ribonuclease HII